MSLSPGNKSGDSFNFYPQKRIARWEPSLMGIIECTTSRGEFQRKRIKHLLKSSEVTKNTRIKINWYDFPRRALSKVILKPISFVTK